MIEEWLAEDVGIQDLTPELAEYYGLKNQKGVLVTQVFPDNPADKGKDRYGRTLARVTCDGFDANAEQVRRGMAWVYDRYVTDKSLYAVQEKAKAERRGLWHDDKPVPPWEWRKDKR